MLTETVKVEEKTKKQEYRAEPQKPLYWSTF